MLWRDAKGKTNVFEAATRRLRKVAKKRLRWGERVLDVGGVILAWLEKGAHGEVWMQESQRFQAGSRT